MLYRHWSETVNCIKWPMLVDLIFPSFFHLKIPKIYICVGLRIIWQSTSTQWRTIMCSPHFVLNSSIFTIKDMYFILLCNVPIFSYTFLSWDLCFSHKNYCLILQWKVPILFCSFLSRDRRLSHKNCCLTYKPCSWRCPYFPPHFLAVWWSHNKKYGFNLAVECSHNFECTFERTPTDLPFGHNYVSEVNLAVQSAHKDTIHIYDYERFKER